jgi:subtilisin-like proprotein convertase family protein
MLFTARTLATLRPLKYLAALGALLALGVLLTGAPAYAKPGSGQAAAAVPPSSTQSTFCNTDLITIVDGAPSNPYPSKIAVSGLSGAITDISVQVNGLGHDFYGDIDMMLAGPQRQTVMLMSDASDTCPRRGVNINFHDGAGNLPTSACPTSGATYQPTNYDYPGWPADYFPGFPPFLTWNTKLSKFIGTDPNGTWGLYIVDDYRLFSGQITNGWCVTLTTSN